MTEKQVIKQLKTLGTAQNRKVYSRHGVQGDQFGVSYANLNKLKKTIKADHDLALELWATGNHDARVLATMIADPKKMTARELDAWVRDLDNYVVTDAFASLAGRTSHAKTRMEKWGKSKKEWVSTAGWQLMAHVALKDGALPDSYFAAHLGTIEKEIHGRKNRARHAMNGALIAIGMRNSKLQKKALTSAKRIGKVDVDHGETSCKTPDAAAYIKKAAGRTKKS